jgi:L-ascorbate metabolism protein UlaG (beta-lactamase superfamily)
MTEAASSSRCTLQFVGTATTILRFGPLTVLTDPNFLHRGQRAYLGYGLVSKRLTQPAITVDRVPALDAILLSHMHGDHWDRVAKKGLPHDVPVLTTPKAARALHRQGFAAAGALDTWDSTTLERDGHTVTVTATPGRHATGLARHLLPPVMGSIVDYRAPDGRALRLYITGDTLFVDDLRRIPVRFPDVDVAVLHLGGTTLPGGLVVTMDARQGTDLLELVRPRVAVPVHYDDYSVFRSPLSAFLAAAGARGLGSLVRVVERGEIAEL